MGEGFERMDSRKDGFAREEGARFDEFDGFREVSAGAGRIGDYERCSWYTAGTGTFYGAEGTSPAVGESETEEHVPELRVETLVPEERLAEVVSALRTAHPYEEPAYEVYPLVDA